MPYPAQVTRDQVVAEARRIIEAEGVDQLSLSKLAAAFSIKAPSLYRHMRNKDELLRAVIAETLAELFERFAAVLSAPVPTAEDRLIALLHTQRQFAHANPRSYLLAFATPELRPDEALLVQMVLPLQQLIAEMAGAADSLAALRGALALVHGYISLELNSQLRRGGDLTADFETAVRAYLRGWVSGEPSTD